MWAYLSRLHEMAQAANVRLHGFGICSWPIIRDFPWYSVDSSDASIGVRFGTLSVYDPYADTWRTWTWKDRAGWAKYGWLVREYEMSPDDFEKTGMLWAQRVALMTISARSWAIAADRLENRTRVYQTPVLNAQAIRSDPSYGTVGREVMETYENANRWAGTRVYVADPHGGRPAQRRNIEVWASEREWAKKKSPPGRQTATQGG